MLKQKAKENTKNTILFLSFDQKKTKINILYIRYIFIPKQPETLKL